MSEYRRFVSYIYEYRKGRKENNCGYAKVDIRNGVFRLRLHLQSAGKSRGVLQVYGFARRQESIFGILLGSTNAKNNVYDFQVTSSAAEIAGSEYSIDDIRGIWLKADNEDYITVWDDEPVLVEQFTTEDTEPEIIENQPAEPVPYENQVADVVEEEPSVQEESMAEEEPFVQEESTAEEEPELQEDSSVQAQSTQSGNLWARWDHFLNHYPQIQPFEDNEITQCICIAPKDLSFLQREEWQFGRNTFVRQAYMRFHHLMLGCHESGRYVLAVPGTNDSQERHMARMYGFPHFKTATAEQEENMELRAAWAEPTGYWYHFLNETIPK